jgi:ubiquinone/menaquinone biosynthesis C-methylase UbiE
MANQNSSEVLAAWETSSQYWNKHQALIEIMYAPLSRALAEVAGIQPGDSVLDIGGGSGEPSLTIARLVGESGSVTYADPAAGMVAAARSEAERHGLHNITFHQAPAESLPFADSSFDRAVGRMSAMFFSDAPAALKESLRVVKSGGRVAFLVWAERGLNPFFSVVTAALDRHVPPEPEAEDAPNAFRFSRSGKLAKLLKEAGAKSVSESVFNFRIQADISVERFWELRTEMSDTFRKKLALVDEQQITAIREEVLAEVAPYFPDGTMDFPGEVLIISGTKA